MEQIFLDLLKNQGASFVLLAAALYFITKEYKKAISKINVLYNEIINEHKQDKEALLTVIINNTKVIEDLADERSEMKNILEKSGQLVEKTLSELNNFNKLKNEK